MAAEVFSGPIRQLLAGLATYGFTAGVLVAGHAVFVVSRTRQRLSREYRNSWLTPAPIPESAVEWIVALRVAAIAMLHLAAFISILLVLHAIADVAL